MEHLAASKDPLSQFDKFDNPFDTVGSTQFGIVPNAVVDVQEASPPSSWPASGPASGSPNRRAGYLRGTRGTAAELRARHMDNKHEAAETARTPSPKKGSNSEPAASLEKSESEWSAQAWDADKLDVLYTMVKDHGRQLYEHSLSIQTLTNKTSVLMGGDIQYQAAIKRNRYNLSNLSSPVASLAAQYDALGSAKDSSDEDAGLAEQQEGFPYGSGAVNAEDTKGDTKLDPKDPKTVHSSPDRFHQ